MELNRDTVKNTLHNMAELNKGEEKTYNFWFENNLDDRPVIKAKSMEELILKLDEWFDTHNYIWVDLYEYDNDDENEEFSYEKHINNTISFVDDIEAYVKIDGEFIRFGIID